MQFVPDKNSYPVNPVDPVKNIIRLGHSPDPDDAFMFYALAKNLIDSAPFHFEHIRQDIQTLNDRALNAELEVTAVSVHAYPELAENYAILSSGASMGATELATYIPDPDAPPLPAFDKPPPTGTHGPLVITKDPIDIDDLPNKTFAIPGLKTSAFLALQLALGKVDHRVIMFDQIPQAVIDKTVDAGLIIHESQLTYSQQGLHCSLDLGKWWFDRTQLPLPLGCNLIRRDLGPEARTRISKILRASILFSLEHRPEAVRYALQFGRGLDTDLADRFIGLYVNEWTLDYGPKGRQALNEFLKQGHQAGLIPNSPHLDFV